MLELKPKPTAVAPRAQAVDNQQPRRLLLALVLLLVALGGVLWRDRDFWFGTDQSTLDADGTETAVTTRAAKSVPSGAATSHTATTAKKQLAPVQSKKSTEPSAAETKTAEAKPAETNTDDSPVVATNRTVLPPLDVEVVAGDNHRTLRPGSNATKVEITRHPSAAQPESTPNFAVATNAAERERVSATDVPQPAASPDASYPLLAQQMKVQGSVVLQALIGADGVIQNLHVLSGPAILASAAEQAVREWRFKPILENGQAVESKAKITVNFTIRIADGSAKTTLAESRPLTIESLSR
jgi:TonB family protein